MAVRKYLTFIQRGRRTWFAPVTDADGSDRSDLYFLSQKLNINILDSEIQNQIIVQEDGDIRVKSGAPFDADLLLDALQTAYPGEFDSSAVIADPLALSTTTTTTTTTSTTTTTTTTTTSTTT